MLQEMSFTETMFRLDVNTALLVKFPGDILEEMQTR